MSSRSIYNEGESVVPKQAVVVHDRRSRLHRLHTPFIHGASREAAPALSASPGDGTPAGPGATIGIPPPPLSDTTELVETSTSTIVGNESVITMMAICQNIPKTFRRLIDQE